MRTTHEDVIDALSEIEIPSSPVQGLGRLAKPLINKYHASGYLSELQGAGERVLLRPSPSSEEEAVPRTPTTTRRELERLECELFDVSKYLGNTNHLTVLTWASDSHWGSITLFEVDTSQSDRAVDWTAKSGSRRRKDIPQEGVRVRPVAGMEDVPKGILVNMRVDQDIRKTVLEHSDGKFRWRSQVAPGPSYARVLRASYDSDGDDRGFNGFDRGRDDRSRSPYLAKEDGRGRRRERPEPETEEEMGSEVESDREPGNRKGSLAERRRRTRPRSLLRVEDALTPGSNYNYRNRTRSSQGRGRLSGGKAETDPETGIVATIPQFMALLHANRSILEVMSSQGGTETVEVDADGEDRRRTRRRETTMRCVTLAGQPDGRRYAGRDVHVVVLMPNASSWAEERIFWGDERGELSELRQKVFWDVIERGRSCNTSASSGRSRSSGHQEGKRSRDLTSRTRKRESRSADGRGSGLSSPGVRRTGGRRYRNGDEWIDGMSRSPPQSARW